MASDRGQAGISPLPVGLAFVCVVVVLVFRNMLANPHLYEHCGGWCVLGAPLSMPGGMPVLGSLLLLTPLAFVGIRHLRRDQAVE